MRLSTALQVIGMIAIVPIIGAGCGGSTGALRQVDAPDWYKKKTEGRICAVGQSVVKGFGGHAEDNAVRKAKANLKEGLEGRIKRITTDSEKGGLTQVNGQEVMAREGATEDIIGTEAELLIQYTIVEQQALVKQKEGYLTPGDTAYARVFFSPEKVNEALGKAAEADAQHRLVLERAQRMLKDAKSELRNVPAAR